ncbi:hypothetical protein AAVH_14928, partial [Aphelenchoides avenae]
LSFCPARGLPPYPSGRIWMADGCEVFTSFTVYFWRTYMPKWLMERQALKRVNKRFNHALYGLKPDHSIPA